MLTCNISLLWDHLEAKILFIPKFLWDKTCCKSNILQRLPITETFSREILLDQIPSQLRKTLQSLCHCNGCWSFTISIPFILILGSKEGLLSAKNLNLCTSFLVSQKVMIGLNNKQMSSNHSSNERKNLLIFRACLCRARIPGLAGFAEILPPQKIP